MRQTVDIRQGGCVLVFSRQPGILRERDALDPRRWRPAAVSCGWHLPMRTLRPSVHRGAVWEEPFPLVCSRGRGAQDIGGPEAAEYHAMCAHSSDAHEAPP